MTCSDLPCTSCTRLTRLSASQAKAAFGTRPAPSHARLGQRLVSGAEKKADGEKKKPEEPTKSENTEKVQKAEKGSDKGSQVVEKVRFAARPHYSHHGTSQLQPDPVLATCRKIARRTSFSLLPTSHCRTWTEPCQPIMALILLACQILRALVASSTLSGSDTAKSFIADGRQLLQVRTLQTTAPSIWPDPEARCNHLLPMCFAGPCWELQA